MKQLIGLIVYNAGWFGTTKQEAYEERVLLDDNFDFNELVRIFETDHTFEAFHILLDDKLIYTTDYRFEKVGYHDGVTAYIDRGRVQHNGNGRYVMTLWNGQQIDLVETDFVFRNRDCFIPLRKYQRDEEIVGTTYDVFAKTVLKHKKKYTYKAVFNHNDAGYYLTKRDALASVKQSNEIAKVRIGYCIRDNKTLNINL